MAIFLGQLDEEKTTVMKRENGGLQSFSKLDGLHLALGMFHI